MCIPKNFIWYFPERTIKSLAKTYFFVQLVWNCFTMNDREAVQSDIFWQWMSKCYTNVTIINQLCVSIYYWYLIMILCPIAHHYCMTLPFIMCNIVEQCLNVGYGSLLTLSFSKKGGGGVSYFSRNNLDCFFY